MARVEQTSDAMFVRRVFIVVGIITLAAIGLVLLSQLAHVLLLIFAALLLAIWLDGLARLASLGSRLSRPWSLTLVFFLLAAAIAGLTWFGGPGLADQVGELRVRVPAAFERIRNNLMELEWFSDVWTQLPSLQQLWSSGGGLLGRVTSVFSTALGTITGIVLVIVLGFYAVIQPDVYTDNLLRLLPSHRRDRAREVLDALARALRSWLVGRFAAMGVVGVLTTVGLMIVGIPLALTLGLLAGILSFVPYVGPVASAIPAVLIALVENPLDALWTVVVYAGVQAVEGNIITPVIQHHAVRIPPVALLTAQMVFAVLFGIVGVFLATPLAVVVIVLTQTLYVEDVLGDEASVLGAD